MTRKEAGCFGIYTIKNHSSKPFTSVSFTKVLESFYNPLFSFAELNSI